jgi:hypothetical protein
VGRWAALLCIIAGTALGQTAATVFDPALERLVQQGGRELDRGRPPLVGPDGRRVASCRALLGAPQRAALVAAVREQRVFAEYQICFALEALQTARPARDAGEAASAPAEALRDQLDLRSFPSSLAPRLPAGRDPVSIARLGAPTATPSRFTVAVEDPAWTFELSVVAAADFDGDGTEDWLVRLTDRAREGSYDGSCFLVVHHVRRPGPLEAACLDARSSGWP